MKLLVGQDIPHFKAHDYQGNEFNSSNMLGKKWMLSFYRYAACPFCNLRIHQLLKKQEQWKGLGMEMISVFQSPVHSIKKYVGQQNPPFTILSDPKMKLYKKFGLQKSWSGLMKAMLRGKDAIDIMRKGFLKINPEGPIHRLPADFLIDEQGLVQEAYYGVDAGDHLDIRVIDQYLQ